MFSRHSNASDTQIFQERTQALMAALKTSPTPRYLVPDSKLYNEDYEDPLCISARLWRTWHGRVYGFTEDILKQGREQRRFHG
jgi:hypothetical protein